MPSKAVIDFSNLRAPSASAQPTGSMNMMDVEAQKKIEEMIKQENVASNMQLAMEHTPEVFAQVIMLYVEVKVNGVPCKAFVDSGAQMTIMNTKFAEECGLLRLLDNRFSGMAKGVGTSKILGRIHTAPIQIGA